MSSRDEYIMGLPQLAETANLTKDMVLARLARDKILTTEQATQLGREYVVVVGKPHWWSIFFKKKDSSGITYNVARFTPEQVEEEKE